MAGIEIHFLKYPPFVIASVTAGQSNPYIVVLLHAVFKFYLKFVYFIFFHQIDQKLLNFSE